MKKRVALVSLLVLGGSLGPAADRPPRDGTRARRTGTPVRRATPAPSTVGTVVYDTGLPHAGLFFSNGSDSLGNRFNSDMGGPLLMTGQITMVTFWINGILGGATITVFGPPNSMGSAAVLGSFGFPTIPTSAFQVAGIIPDPTGPDFLVGMGLNSSAGVGMDDQSASGQGFHAFQIQAHFQSPGTMFQTIPGRNALVRATGDILVPVELMNFSIQ